MNSMITLIPIYREALPPNEELSLTHSVKHLQNRAVVFVAPEGLDIGWYRDRCGFANEKRFPQHYFDSIRGYNELLLSPAFYREFAMYEFMLVLQTDAVLFRNDLDSWLVRGFDYVGAPWPDGVEILVNLGQFDGSRGKKVRTHVGNGGLSLRRISKCASLLEEFKVARDVFLRSGSSEDLFFGILGQLSTDFRIPNEITASRFSMELKPEYYFSVNGEQLPVGAHAWWKYNPEFWHLHTGLRSIPDT